MRRLALLGFLLAIPGFGSTWFLSTDHTNANTTIDSAHTSSWLLTPNTAFDLGGGIFTMKDGSQTDQDVTLSLYLGSDNSGTLLASVTLTPADFTQTYTDTNFFFSSPVSLLSGTTYFAALSSPVDTQGSKQYFIKDGGPVITDAIGTPIDPPPIGDTTGTVPEPSTLGLLGASLLGLAAFKRRKSV